MTASLGGARTADLVVYDDAPDGPHAIPVNGTGVGEGNLVLSSDSWTFGGHAVGQASGPGTIYVHNSGTDTVHFASIASVPIVGQLSTDFAIRSNTCGTALAGSKSCAVTFVFTPTFRGDRYGNLILTDDSANSPQIVHLTGFGH